MQTEKKYRIRCTSLINGNTGTGTGKFSYTEAKHYADEMNLEKNNVCYYTVELVEKNAN